MARKCKVEATEPPTEEQIRRLERLGLKASRTKKSAQYLIWYLERAKHGVSDDRYFNERVALVKRLQEERLGKKVRWDQDPERLGTIIDLQFGYTGLQGYFVDWGTHASSMTLKSCKIVD